MKVLVTGGAGFIGSHLVDSLLEAGEEVIVLDDLSTGDLSNLPLSSATHRGTLHIVQGSVLNSGLVNDVIATTDRVYHLAAAVGVQRILSDARSSARINVIGTMNVVDAAVRHRNRLIFTSSSEVYGSKDGARMDETEPCQFRSPGASRWSYAYSKLLSESYILSAVKSTGLEAMIARLFNVVGPRQSSANGMVIPRLIQQALRNEPLTVYGNGEQLRSFLYVGDVVRGLQKLASCTSLLGLPVNLGSDRCYSILELAKTVRRLTGSRSPIECIPFEAAFGPEFVEPEWRRPGLDRARTEIEFSPTLDLEQIITVILEARQAHPATQSSRGGTYVN